MNPVYFNSQDGFYPTLRFRWFVRPFKDFGTENVLQQYYLRIGSIYLDDPTGEWRCVEQVTDPSLFVNEDGFRIK